MKFYDRLFPPKKWSLPSGQTVLEKRSRAPLSLGMFCGAVLFSLAFTKFDVGKIAANGAQFWTVFRDMFPPNHRYFSSVLPPLLETIKMSFVGSVLGSLCAVPFAILAANNIVRHRLLNQLIRIIFSLLRTLPTLVVALIATYIWGLGAFAGTVAIFIFTFSYIGKQLFEQIETVDMGAFEALEALGSSKGKSFVVAIMPQLLPIFLSTVLFTFEGNVRYAAILGYVGAGGLGVILNEKISWREYPNVGMILLALLVTVAVIESISKFARKKLT